MEHLTGQVAIITGAAGGIGRAIAELYAQEGAVVVIMDKDVARTLAAHESIARTGAQVRSFSVDVRDYERVESAFRAVASEFGKLDIIVNNAAIGYDGDFLTSALEEWREVIAVDLEAVYMGSKLAAQIMAQQQRGRIISIASLQALMTTGRTSAYNTAKAGLLGLTHAMAVDLAPHNIAVNTIAPGFIRSGMSILPNGVDETTTPEFHQYYLERRRIPLARAGEPNDVAGVALFLASDYCRYMTGQTLLVDGGLSLTI